MEFDINKIIQQIDEIGKNEYNHGLSEGERRAFADYISNRGNGNEAYQMVVSGLTSYYAKSYFENAVFLYYNEPPEEQVKFYWKVGEIYRACVSF